MTGARSLVIAIILRAIRDYQNDEFRSEVDEFFHSEDFIFMWELVTEGLVGIPNYQTFLELVTSGCLSVGRMAYHSNQEVSQGV